MCFCYSFIIIFQSHHQPAMHSIVTVQRSIEFMYIKFLIKIKSMKFKQKEFYSLDSNSKQQKTSSITLLHIVSWLGFVRWINGWLDGWIEGKSSLFYSVQFNWKINNNKKWIREDLRSSRGAYFQPSSSVLLINTSFESFLQYGLGWSRNL